MLLATNFNPGIDIVINTALGIVRVQCRSFIGTGAQRSPAKPAPFPIFSSGLVTPRLVGSLQFIVGSFTANWFTVCSF
ncbi:hypothetical protein ASE74_01565 [Pedobacter sp. Leaf216]|nr:hypothetical protein ASE74_01565 [Pedobacter sp. Leaf216]